MPREVDLRFIALLSPFYRTEGPVCEGKVGEVKSSSHLKFNLDPAAWVASM